MSGTKFYPPKRGNTFRIKKGKKEGAWKKSLLELSEPMDKAIEDFILELHDKGHTLEEISYMVNTSVYHAIGKYSMLGKVVRKTK